VSIRSDRRYEFAQERPAVWDALGHVDRYRTWWSWLRDFDGTEMAAGERWHCVVKPPLPYMLRFVIELTDVIEAERVVAELEGDINGSAHISLADQGPGCELRLVSDLSARGGVAGFMDRIVHPLAAVGHDWVLDNGIRQFRRRAFDP